MGDAFRCGVGTGMPEQERKCCGMKKQIQTPFWAGLAACALPLAAGLLAYGRLPGQMAVQWNSATGEVLSLMSKPWAVIAIPVVLMVMHWVIYASVHSMVLGKRLMGALREGISWLMPLLSVIVYGLLFSANLRGGVQISAMVYGLVGLAFLVVGGYTPQLVFGSRWGIRDEYTALGEEHWQRVHSFAGLCLALCGGSILVCGWLHPGFAWWMIVWPLLLAAPHCYSFWLEKQEVSA